MVETIASINLNNLVHLYLRNIQHCISCKNMVHTSILFVKITFHCNIINIITIVVKWFHLY